MGFGKKIDPEPGRCRRTDGKKWRCSKEAYPDSKYCERHMHRGRNRSRKPVEVITTDSPTHSSTLRHTPTAIPISSITKNSTNPTSHPFSSCFTSAASSEAHHQSQSHPCYNTSLHHHPFLYPHTSSSRPPGLGLLSHDNTTNFLLESGAYSHTGKDYRNSYDHGMKEGVDEHAFFSEASGTMRSTSCSSGDDAWKLTMGSPTLGHLKERTSSSASQTGHSYLHFQGLNESSRQQRRDQHYYAFGNDVESDAFVKMDREDQPRKVMHHFIDEWPPKNKDSWLDSEEKFSTHIPVSKTHLSISIPNSSHDFFTAHNEK